MTGGFISEDKPRSNETVTVRDAQCIRQTERAICVRIGKRELWVPQSVVDDDSEVYARGDHGKLVVAAWFAEKEGLE